MRQRKVSLFISAARAMSAAEDYLEDHPISKSNLTYRIAAATMKDEDGTVDNGFKAQIVTTEGEHCFFL